MIRGLHGLFYSSEPEAARAFIRDKLQLPYTDTGGGWLIFDLPESELGVHPSGDKNSSPAGTHDVSFYCDNIHATVSEESQGLDRHSIGTLNHHRVFNMPEVRVARDNCSSTR